MRQFAGFSRGLAFPVRGDPAAGSLRLLVPTPRIGPKTRGVPHLIGPSGRIGPISTIRRGTTLVGSLAPTLCVGAALPDALRPSRPRVTVRRAVCSTKALFQNCLALCRSHKGKKLGAFFDTGES